MRKLTNRLNGWIGSINSYEAAKAIKTPYSTLNADKTILFDQYSRYKACADILKKVSAPEDTILDVGSGEECILEVFLPSRKITFVDPLLSLHPDRTGNKIAGDVFTSELNGQKFDFAVSIDALEHIPQEERELFIERIISLSKKGVVIACPCSDAGDAIETDTWLNDVYVMAHGKEYSWLQEHIKYGLPSLSAVLNKFKMAGWQTQVIQNGHTPWLRELLGVTLCSWDIPDLKPVILELSAYFNNNLSDFDNQEPCYRQIIIASKDKFPDFSNTMYIGNELKKEISKRWEVLHRKLISSYPKVFMHLSESHCEQLDSLTNQLDSLTNQLDSLTNQLDSLTNQHDSLTNQHDSLTNQLHNTKNILDDIYSSNFWKIATFYYKLRDNTPIIKHAYKSLKIIKNEGIGVFLRKAGRNTKDGYIKYYYTLRRFTPSYKKGLLSAKKGLLSAANAGRYDIIFFSIINWDFRFQRPQHIATKFAEKGHRILYLNVDLRRQNSYFQRQITENVYEIILPFKNNTSIYNAELQTGMDILTSSMKNLFNDFKVKESVAYVEFPLWYPLVERMKNEFGSKVIFDCLDEFSGFNYVHSNIVEAENMLMILSDACITTSLKLFEKHKGKCKNMHIIRNATEFDHFHNLPVNNILKNIPKPIIGYYGAIAEWFDTQTVEYIATQRPHWSIILIGHTFGSDIDRIKKYKNIHLLGEKPYSELPKFLYAFDVCMIPFKLNELILSTNPVKFYEFISSGKPVVSVPLPELLPYKEYCYLSSGKEEFLENINKALNENDHELIQKRIDLARVNDWEHRYQEIEKCIQKTYPLVSIIMVTFNNLKYTKLCVESIYGKTAYSNFELIIVDNASIDETKDYLKSLKEQYDNLKFILNIDNKGFAAANNIGIKQSEGEYVILLNNDTIVTRGWISGLLKYLRKPGIGMVGPVTNSIGNEARINVNYTGPSVMEDFVEQYTRKHSGIAFEIPVLAMYCLALSRQTIEKVGLLDEQFYVGMFEDDDYALRVKKAGLKIICTEDVFIHHFGGASFLKLKSTEYQKIFNENKKKFETKWGVSWKPHKYRDGII